MDALHDGLIAAVLAQLSPAERQRAALTCRRWLRLSTEPAQLACLEIHLAPPRFQQRLDSLCAWLARHAAGHVQRLRLHLLPGPSLEADVQREAAATLAAALAVVAASLRQLELLTPHDVSLGGWLAPLARLQRLRVFGHGSRRVAVSGDLRPLTALRALTLACDGGEDDVRLAPSSHLPAGVTRLSLGGSTADFMPPQVAALTGLRELRLRDVRWHSYDALPAMPALTVLELSGCHHVPACLSRLTQLRVLTLAQERHAVSQLPGLAAEAAVLSAALPHLRQLTRLALVQLPLWDLQGVSGLSQLRAAHLEPWEPCRLPCGPWLAGLQRLVVPADTLVRGLARWAPVPSSGPGQPPTSQLLAAQHLRALGVLASGGGASQPDLLDAALQHAARLPQLRLLACDAPLVPDGCTPALREAGRRRPELRVRRPELRVQLCATADEVAELVMGS